MQSKRGVFMHGKKGELSITNSGISFLVIFLLVIIIILAASLIKLTLEGWNRDFCATQARMEGDIYNERVKQIQADCMNDFIEKAKLSDDLLFFNLTQVSTMRGVQKQLFVVLKNNESTEKCYTILFRCMQSFSNGLCEEGKNNPLNVGGESPLPGYYNDKGSMMFQTFTEFNVDSKDTVSYPIYLQVTIPKNSLRLIEMIVFRKDTACGLAGSWQEFQKKTFTLRVV